MAYIFQEDKLPKLISVVPGRERTFFVNKELTHMDDMLAGIMHYVKGGSSPYHLHKNCAHPSRHFFILSFRRPTVSSPRFWTGRRTIFAGNAWKAESGFRPKCRSEKPHQ